MRKSIRFDFIFSVLCMMFFVLSVNRKVYGKHKIKVAISRTKLQSVRSSFNTDRFNNQITADLSRHSDGSIQFEVSGKVSDAATGKSMPGVNVVVKGTTNGTATDVNGHYDLSVASSSDTLVFSYIGYKMQEIPIQGRSRIDVSLTSKTISGQELVVVGYGIQKRSDLTGSISSVNEKDFNAGITTNPEQLIQGKAAGVQITQRSGDPNASAVVNIRGVGSLRSGSSPLYVVDGVPLSGNANFLDGQDIQSIDVLKDASATAIYGARASNGVILITTKKGHKGSPTLTYNAYTSISDVAKELPVLNAQEFINFQDKYGNPNNIYSNSVSTNWQNEIFRTAYSQNHDLSYSGGTDNSTYRVSLNYKNQEGIVLNSRRKNYNGSLNLTQSFLNNRLTLSTNLHGIFIRANNTAINNGTGGVSGDLLSHATTANPTYPVYNKDGTLFQFPVGINPLVSAKRNTDFSKETRILGDIQANLNIIKGLNYKARFSADQYDIIGISQQAKVNVSSGSADIGNINGRLSNSTWENTNYTVEQDITYKYDTDVNSLTLLGGYSYQQFNYQSRSWSINNFSTTEIDAFRNPGIGTDLSIDQNRPGGSAYINKLQSFYGRVNYNYNSKYYLTATLRADGSSKFGNNKQYGLFPSFAVSWRLSDEPFLSGFKPLSDLKLRAGWGQTGNQNIPPYITKQLVTVETGQGEGYYFGNTNYAGITLVRAQNENLHWETSTQTNVGLDFSFFGDRLSGTIDAYNKISSDILFESTTSEDPIQPTTSFWKNYNNMEIHNKGLELSLEYQQHIGSNLSLDVGGNVSFLHNNVTGVPVKILQTGQISGQGLSGVTVNGLLDNHPVGTFYLLDWIGLDANGMNKFRDVNNDGTINADDYITAGSALPKSTFGGFINLFYKNIDFSVNVNGVYGNKVYWNDQNAYYSYSQLAGGKNSLQSTASLGGKESIQNSATPSTRWLHDGSYLRLNNATIGYSINTRTINWLKKLRLYVTGQNLFVITSYPGYDPAVDTSSPVNGFRSFGIDGTSYPRARTFIFGINLTL